MRLHRLALTNYRGITRREITFPDDGVVVVSGPNEVGKSSMIEALDLLLEVRDRSGRKDVKQVQPTNADVGAEVTAEISTGPYRFVYRKRFHKKPETQLTVAEPHREQLTGDEAHERVAAIFAETVDAGLWRAQRVLQAASTDAVDLSGCDALSRALDIAAGDSVTLTGAETLLIERIDAEYSRYFTPRGRPTAEWAAAKAGLTEAEREVAHWTAAVAEVDQRVARHAELVEQLAVLDCRRDTMSVRHHAARSAAQRVAALTEELREAKLQAAVAAVADAESMAVHTERVRLRDEVNTRAASLAGLELEAAKATAAVSAATAQRIAADTAVQDATVLLDTAEQHEETARRVVDRLSELAEADRLATRLGRIDTAERDRDRITAELTEITLTEAMLRDIEDAAAVVDRTAAQLAAISATVEVTAGVDVDLMVAGQRVALIAGEGWSTVAPTEFEIPGMLTVRVSPGEVAQVAEAKHAAAKHDLASALATAAVADLATARAVDQRRRELQGNRDQLNATLTALCGDDEQPDLLRNRLAQLRTVRPEDAGLAGVDGAAARAELETAGASRVQAAKDCEIRRVAAAAAAAEFAEKSTRAKVLQDNVVTQRAELAAVADRLAAERDSTGDDVLASVAIAGERAVQAASRQVSDLSEKLSSAEPDKVAAELADAIAAVDTLCAQRHETARELDRVTAELDVLGREGRQTRLDAAEVNHEHATAEHATVGRRARTAELLRRVMLRHRDDIRQRYVEPFRTELERLGATVFGPSFEVEVDSQLCIGNRTLDGCTVPYESLSGGAKEQLGILTRLAGAALVAKEDTVPVLIDDALGFTDPGRLASIGAAFDAVGARGQVIVLTCTPDRYQSIEGAHRIDLSS